MISNNYKKKSTLNVLISAYACEPLKGSEPGVGWDWALEIARRGNNVVLLTRSNNSKNIQKYLITKNKYLKGNIKFIYYDLPRWVLVIKKRLSIVRFYYFLWQYFASLKLKKILQKQDFDILHHLTFVSLRHFSHLGNFGKPLVLGPLAGGDSSPRWIRRYISWKFLISEYLRDLLNIFTKYDPFFQQSLKSSEIIICSTSETQRIIPNKFRSKSKLINQLYMEKPKKIDFYRKRNSKNILFVGRFISYKGMDIGLESFAFALKKDKSLKLTMVGEGSKKEKWQLKAKNLGISNSIKWLPYMSQDKLNMIYLKNSIFLFPSLHDSGGKVLFEAISRGLRVITLNIGGPSLIINNKVGKLIEVKNSNRDKLINDIAESILEFAACEYESHEIYRRAAAHYEDWKISKVIDKVGIY